MRLVIKDYLLQLKEKDELDLLLCDLLLQMGYITDNKPETGNRQYGVDIRAHNKWEILLCVVKQGNLKRNNWDSGKNAVRQSLNDIKDVYIELIKGKEREKKLRIVVATNGVIDEAVRPNWEGYKSQNVVWNGMEVNIEFWGIDELVDYIQKYLFDEHIFGAEMQRLLRRALYYTGKPDYRNGYFECIIDSYIAQFNNKDVPKVQKKKLAGLYLASQMVAQYAAETGTYKISVNVTEYLIIRYWKYMLEYNYLGKSQYVEWLHKFLFAYEKWNQKYFEEVRYCCEGKNRIPLYNPVEQRVMLYEMLGYLVSYAYYLSFQKEYNIEAQKKCRQIQDSIISLINNYSQYPYAPYDQHVGIISMLYRFLGKMGRTEDIECLLQYQCIRLAYYYIIYKKYPTAQDTFEDAINIHMGFQTEDYLTSGFWGTMMEWIVLMEQKDLYQQLYLFLKEDLAKVTKCVWFLRAEEETSFYDAYAMNSVGEGMSISEEKTFEELKEKVLFCLKQYEGEKFSFEEYSFEPLEFIVCRYYGYLVRVKKE